MTTRKEFDRFVGKQTKDPEVRAEYEKARSEIAMVDAVMRALDAARIEANISKAELARKMGAKPEIVRRLFTNGEANPTLATIAKLATALDLKLLVVSADSPVSETSSPKDISACA